MSKKSRLATVGLTVVAVPVLALAAWGYFGQSRISSTEHENKIHHLLCGYTGSDDALKEFLVSKPNLNFHFSTSPDMPLAVALEDYNGCGTSLSRIEMLIKAGADVNMKGIDGPPLNLAVLSSRPDAVALLLKSGADVNEVDGKGYTAAMRIWNSNEKQPLEMLSLLIDAGIDLGRKAPDGMTARDVAVKIGRTDLVQMIDQAR